MALVLSNLRSFMVAVTSAEEGDRYLPVALVEAIEQSLADALQPMAETKANGELKDEPQPDPVNNANNISSAKNADGKEASTAVNSQAGDPNQPSPGKPSSEVSSSPKPENEAELTEISDRLAQLKQQEQELQKRQQELAQREQEIKKSEFDEFLEGLIKDGKLLPSEKQTLLAFMMALPDSADAAATPETAQFSEANSQPSAIATFKKSLRDRPRIVTFGEVVGRTNKFMPMNETKAIQEQAQAYIAEQRAIGKELSVSEAVAMVRAAS
jgi:DNA-binding protein H-NS